MSDSIQSHFQSDITDDDIMMYLQHYEKRLDEIQAFHQVSYS